jgi:hypothetical protein
VNFDAPERYPHYLRRTKAASWPYRVLCFDCESEVEALPDGREGYSEKLVSISWIELKRDDQAYVYCGEGKSSAADGLWDRIASCTKRGSPLTVMCYQATRNWSLAEVWRMIETGRLTIESRRGRGGSTEGAKQESGVGGILTLRDPPLIFRLALEQTGAWLTGLDVRNYGTEPPSQTDRGTATARWLADWWQRWAALCRSYRCGKHCYTAGGQALESFRATYYSGGILCHQSDEAISLEERSYYGGRSECYRIGDAGTRLSYLDIRGSYTHCYRTCRVGERPRSEVRPGSRYCWPDDLPAADCIASVQLETDEPAYPYRRRARTEPSSDSSTVASAARLQGGDTDVIYPVGRFWTVLAGPELSDAVVMGRVRQVARAVQYYTGYALKAYGEAMDAMRCECDAKGEKDLSRTAKLMSNCLWGKFGQRVRSWGVDHEQLPPVQYGEFYARDSAGHWQLYRSVGGLVQRDCVGGLSRDAAPSVAAWIASHGRMALLRVLRAIGWERCYYCDTDAVMCDDEGVQQAVRLGMVAADTLGKLGIRWSSSEVWLAGIKYYRYDSTTVCAGLPSGCNTDIAGQASYLHSQSPTDSVRNGYRPTASCTVRSYSRTGEYTHGTVDSAGRVSPIELWED